MRSPWKTRRSVPVVPFYAAAVALVCFTEPLAHARRPDGQLELSVVDAADGQPTPVRLHLRDARGRATHPARGIDDWGTAPLGDHVYLEGPAVLGLKRGAYRFDLDAGPEYRTQSGHFEIVRHAEDTKLVEMTRAADVAKEGWYAADLASCRRDAHYPLLQRAERLAYTPKVAVAWRDGAWAKPDVVDRKLLDREPAGATALWDDPRGVVWLIDPDGSRSVDALPTPGDSSVAFLAAVRDGGWRVIASVTSHELPLWIAHELLDAVVVIDDWSESKAGKQAAKRGRQPDNPILYPGDQGPGRWRRALYESLLEAGVHLPPVALTGSGLNTTPIGTSRVYAYTGGDDSTEAWWQATERLALVATNGPLLRPFVEGLEPGETFFLDPTGRRKLSIALNLATRTKIEYLEIVKNGRVVHNVRLAEFAAAGGKLPEVAFDAPGWLAIAAVAENQDRYELAMSAPWFVEAANGGQVNQDARAGWLSALQQARKAFGATDTEAYQLAESYWQPSP